MHIRLRVQSKSQLHVNIHRKNFETQKPHTVNAAILEQQVKFCNV